MEVAIILIIIIGVVLVLLNSGNGNSNKAADEKIRDSEVCVDSAIYHLDKFKPAIRADRKNGFTEKDIHEQLELYLKNIFFSVTREYAIEGKNVKRIDFDIGNGKVGIEVKLAESVIKEGEGDRVIGQMLKLTARKYNNENLIIAVVGFAEHTRNTVIHETEEFVKANKAHFVFLKAKNKS